MAFDRRSFAGGGANTTIPAGCDGSTETITIADATGWPTGSGGNFYAVIDLGEATEEKVLVDTRSGTVLTLASGGRGADGTAAVIHSIDATIALCLAAVDLDEANEHVSDSRATAHAAAKISFTPAGTIAADDVQEAIEEVDGDVTALTATVAAIDTTLPANVARLETGNYTGDGTSNRKITTTFDPEFVVVVARDSTVSLPYWLSSIGGGTVSVGIGSSSATAHAVSLLDPTTGGFLVDSSSVNASGKVYDWVAFGVAA